LKKEVESKVQHDQETLNSKITVELKEEKEQAQQKKDELKKKLEEKELELMTLKSTTQRNHLANFQKTEAKPCIYYKPSDKTKGTTKDTMKVEEKEEIKESKRGHGRHSRSRSNSRSISRSKSPESKKEISEPMQTEEK